VWSTQNVTLARRLSLHFDPRATRFRWIPTTNQNVNDSMRRRHDPVSSQRGGATGQADSWIEQAGPWQRQQLQDEGKEVGLSTGYQLVLKAGGHTQQVASTAGRVPGAWWQEQAIPSSQRATSSLWVCGQHATVQPLVMLTGERGRLVRAVTVSDA
jgi:hypothetical protein